jgi:hypothetical protein
VINDLIRIRALNIRTHDNKMLFFCGLIPTGGMRVPLPKRREQRFHGVFVPDSENNYGLAQIDAHLREGILEDFADLSNWSAILRASFSPVLLMTVKSGERTSTQVS